MTRKSYPPIEKTLPLRIIQPQAEQPLPRWLRVLLTLVGTTFLLIGIVMLAIPVLPQVWAFALAAVCFSVASQSVWRWLERRLRRWPRLHTRACSLRSWLLDRLSR